MTIPDYLNALHMVDWDRCTGTPESMVIVYGWIHRDDGHNDFVAVTFVADEPVSFVSSSQEFDKQIHTVLFGPEDLAVFRFGCLPVLGLWPSLNNVVDWQNPQSKGTG